MRVIDLAARSAPEMLGETVPNLHAITGFVVDRHVFEIALCLGGGSAQHCPRSNLLRPYGLDDWLEDRQRHMRPCLAGAERAALAIAVVVADPDRNRHVVGEADEPAVDRILGRARFAGDVW